MHGHSTQAWREERGNGMNIGEDFGAYKMETKDLKRKLKAAQKKADRFRDRHGIIGRNIEQEKADAYRFELMKRNKGL